MKANVGMEYAVAAAVSAYTPYSSITYSAGFVVTESRGATLTWETQDGEFRGDNIVLDTAENVIGYTLDFETAGLKDAVRASLLGETKDSGDAYHITGADSPDVGFGYCSEMREDSSGSVTTTWEAWWLHKIKFKQPNMESRTEEKNKEWRSPTISGKGAGVFLSAGATAPDYVEHKTFATLALAKAYLNGKAGIT